MTPPQTGNRLSWLRWVNESQPSILEQLRHWLSLTKADPDNKDCNLECYQLEELEIRVLVRRRTQGFPGNCLVIATVDLPSQLQSQGWFKSFLRDCSIVNPWKTLIIEDVNNKRLETYCKKSEFMPLSLHYSNTFIVDLKSPLNNNKLD
ncbi:hypothetical protein JBO49_26770 [Serratia fonticola]|uniref:hypothetical protein n=1 Tax=Serratia fonticola TaxID=47917 RepID=UPI00192B9847|nr:hypothetical protein [Serratia fonticola]MBL5864211.1 hypothetical protein [Serratia fonticola]